MSVRFDGEDGVVIASGSKSLSEKTVVFLSKNFCSLVKIAVSSVSFEEDAMGFLIGNIFRNLPDR